MAIDFSKFSPLSATAYLKSETLAISMTSSSLDVSSGIILQKHIIQHLVKPPCEIQEY